ncbi:MAG: cytochrome c3 family protein [Myxococcota bacterium]
MRKSVILTLVGAVLVLAVALAFAVDNVTNTKHDLSSGSTAYPVKGAGQLAASNVDEICIFCHTPHAASATMKPLWNHNADAGAFTMYNSAWSSTIDETVESPPGGVSAACLACHDGATAMNSIINNSGTAPDNDAMITGATTNLGKTLTNDHPISITYRTVDMAFNAAGTLSPLKLYSGKVECGSCHNPHDNTTAAPFLRMSNAASAMCLKCHIK